MLNKQNSDIKNIVKMGYGKISNMGAAVCEVEK